MNIDSEKEDSDVATLASIPFLWERIARKLLTGIETRGGASRLHGYTLAEFIFFPRDSTRSFR